MRYRFSSSHCVKRPQETVYNIAIVRCLTKGKIMSRITYHSANVVKVGFCSEKEGKESVVAEVKATKQQT